MSTATYKKSKPSKAKLAQLREQRAAELTSLRESLEGFTDALVITAAVAQHDGYSPRNAMLIAIQRPDATDVAGFREWISRGRRVRKGEHGIRILAPAGTYPAATEEAKGDTDPVTKEWTRFRVTSVFDVSQTDPYVPSQSGSALLFDPEEVLGFKRGSAGPASARRPLRAFGFKRHVREARIP
jgi:N-terminal domain of anti-restriction factor ArdC